MNSSNNQPRAVLWDLDGTLIDSMAYHWEAWNDVLQPLGYHFSVESFAPTIGLRNEDIVRDFLKIDRPQSDIDGDRPGERSALSIDHARARPAAAARRRTLAENACVPTAGDTPSSRLRRA